MSKTPKEWANELVEAWAFGTDVEEEVAKWVIQDLRDKAEATFILVYDQGYKRGFAEASK